MGRLALLAAVLLLGCFLLLLAGISSGAGGLGGGVLQRLGAEGGGLLAEQPTAKWFLDERATADQVALAKAGSAPRLHVEVEDAASLETTATSTTTPRLRTKYGFYLHVFQDPAAVIHQVRQLKKFFPGSPVYVMSDGGLDFSGLCELENCTFQLCPPANDRWHPWPFFRRIYDAAIALDTQYIVMLEPDNTVHGPITRHPAHDAGGLFVHSRRFGLVEYVERLASERVPGYKWTRQSMQAGLAGGSYFRREAILDAFSDEVMAKIDWNYVADAASKEIFSSDFAMQYALAARGWSIEPWEDCAQMDRDKDTPLTGPQDAAFRHYCSCYPGGKPTYNLQLKPEDKGLFRQAPRLYGQLNSVCQLCYNLSRYVELWGSSRCTNSIHFTYSETLMARHHPEMKDGCPHFLPWLCDGKKQG